MPTQQKMMKEICTINACNVSTTTTFYLLLVLLQSLNSNSSSTSAKFGDVLGSANFLFLPTVEYNFYSICTNFLLFASIHRNCVVFILIFLSRLRWISFRGYRNSRMRNQCYSFTLQRFPSTDRPQHEKERQRKQKTRLYRMCKRIVCKKMWCTAALSACSFRSVAAVDVALFGNMC